MAAILLILPLLLPGPAAAFAQESRPNILWITCEDISPYLSMYGDSTARTPNLDRLAAEGTTYQNAFATVAVCAPNRSSLITGMYPTSIGTMHMRAGKDVMGWGARDYSGPCKAVDINGDSVPLYAAVIPPHVRCFTEYLRKAGYYCTNSQKTDYQFAAPVTAWDENGPEAHWRNRQPGQPFFAVFNHGITHESRIWKNMQLAQTVPPDSVPLPHYFPDDSIIRQDVARNYSNIELLDREVGERLRQLEEDGLLDNTIIFFFSDHGGPLPRGKREIYDSGLRTPLLIRLPNQPGGKMEERLVSHVDLAPTVLALAGVDIPGHMQGEAFLGPGTAGRSRDHIFGSGDRFDEFTDRIRIARDKRWLYVRNYHPELPAYKDIAYRRNMDMMNQLLDLEREGRLNGDQSYWFRPVKTKEELYDCENDPENLHNLIDDTAFVDKVLELRAALDGWLAKTGDRAVVPEKQMYLEMWPGGVQPATARPQVSTVDDFARISCETEGASIGFIISEERIKPGLDSGWSIYKEPIKVRKGLFLYTVSQRIGFRESEIVTHEF